MTMNAPKGWESLKKSCNNRREKREGGRTIWGGLQGRVGSSKANDQGTEGRGEGEGRGSGNRSDRLRWEITFQQMGGV